LLDDVALMAIKGQGIPFHDDAKAVLIVELDGSSDEGVFADLNRVAGLAKQHGSLDAQLAVDRDQRERIWATRKAVSPALRALKKFKFSEDIVVPRSKIPEAIERFKEIGKKLNLTVATYGHAGDGNLHTNVLYAGPHERPQVDAALAEIMRETVALGGTISGEHGVGLTKQQFVALEQSAPLIALQKQLKAMLDPACLFNPGKLFPRE
jgi:glycolate oxidase